MPYGWSGAGLESVDAVRGEGGCQLDGLTYHTAHTMMNSTMMASLMSTITSLWCKGIGLMPMDST